MPLTLIPRMRRMSSQAKISSWRRLVRRIDAAGEPLRNIDDHELRKKSLALKYEARCGKQLEELLVDAYALVREAGDRAMGMRHYEVQLLGGIAIFFDSIVEMQTGEGKTLTATLPLYLNALTGKGSHLATANDYLAERDAEIMQPVYAALGMTVGVVQSDTQRPARQSAYQCDITYSTAKEFGFDFLRDRLLLRQQQLQGERFVSSLMGDENATAQDEPVQRGHNFVLIDEADSILIDEARTPLIVSSIPDEIAKASIALYQWCAEVCSEFENETHYEFLPKSRQLDLTPEGRRFVRKLKKPALLAQTPILDIYEQMELAIYVDDNYIRDRHYVVRDGEIVIVDEFTGRLAEGRKWKAGIHQAIEAREEVEISIATSEAARITVQDLCLRYNRIAGMTGTIGNSDTELQKIYEIGVVRVPTNKPSQREQWPDRVFGTEESKWQAIVEEVAKLHQTGRPVLIGTRSIDKSEILAGLLDTKGIKHEVLNAKNLPREAEIVAEAGQLGRVTVATNMAGRGTDIKVGDDALELGGLHVICTEMHESARIDRQLIGRCGRQGDVGTFRQFMSLEDDLLKVGFGQKRADQLATYKSTPQAKLDRMASLFRQAQLKVEREHFQSRKMLLHKEKIRSEMQLEMGQDPFLDVAGA